MSPDEFDAAWRTFVARWATVRTEDAAARELVDAVLEHGLPPAADPVPHPEHSATLGCAVAVVKRAGAVDQERYRESHPTDRNALRSPIRHFCDVGWKHLDNPRPDFDVWWYWSEHLDPGDDRVNPLLHHLLVGRRLGLPTVPLPTPRAAFSFPEGHRPRRLVLFAGADPDGIVDATVVTYVTELARHGEVHYLADSTLLPGELDKLAGITSSATALRHGRGRVGAWAFLAGEILGWEALGAYDEVLFVDDEAYLVRDLDEIFARMDVAACDWWGLHAVKRNYSVDDGATEPVPFESARRMWSGVYEMDPRDHLRTGSHFVACRAPVIADPGLQRRLGAAKRPLRFPTGATFAAVMSRDLAGRGFTLGSATDEVWPDDPMQSPDVWTLVGRGHPLLARSLLVRNQRRVPDLADWKEHLGSAAPGADLDAIERHLLRVAPDDELQSSFSVRSRPDGTSDFHAPLSFDRFRREDEWTPKFDHWWAFPVCAYDHTLAGNGRAVFEQVRDDPSVKKIILTRSRRVELSGENVVSVPLMSREGQEYLLRSRQIFVKHGPQVDGHWPLSPMTHHVINLWHGIALKRFGSAAATISSGLERALLRNNGATHAVITSSRMDRLAMTTAFWPLSYTEMWDTGLPRNDFITCNDDRLPADLRATERRLRDEVGDRRLVMFLPTFKDSQADAYYRFTADELAWIAAWLDRHHAVLGVREHMADEARTYWHQLAPLGSIDLSNRRYPDIEVLYRVADGLVSDYSSCLVDFMLTGRPLASFAYDLEHYANEEPGLFYDLDRVLPGAVCRTFDELAEALDGFFEDPDPATVEEHAWRRRIFHDHLDAGASRRVVERVRALDAPPERSSARRRRSVP